MKKHKPLSLLNNKGFWPDKPAVVDAIKEVLTAGRCRRPPAISDYGHYRDRQWRDDKMQLVPYKSVDWYVFNALDEGRMQVNAERLLNSFVNEPWRRPDVLGDHYDLFVMDEDMFDPHSAARGEPVQYVIGRAEPGQAAVVSTYRLEHIWGMPYSYLKTEVMRQICFMFGVPDPRRPDVTVEGGRAYCANRCVLRAAHIVPEDWDTLTEDRLSGESFCESCRRDLRAFFDQLAAEAD